MEGVWKVFECCLEHVFKVSWKYQNLLFIEGDYKVFLWLSFPHLLIEGVDIETVSEPNSFLTLF